MAAPGYRCHYHDRSLRQQRAGGRDLEEDVGSPLAAGVFGPLRDRWRRSLCRAAAPGQRRLQHRRRRRPGVAVGAGVAAGGAYRPTPDDRGGPQVLVRCDSAGATHTFADACRAVGVGFSFGYAVDARVRDAAETLNAGDSWYPAIESSGGIRDGARVAEATSLVDMSHWPNGT